MQRPLFRLRAKSSTQLDHIILPRVQQMEPLNYFQTTFIIPLLNPGKRSKSTSLTFNEFCEAFCVRRRQNVTKMFQKSAPSIVHLTMYF